MRVGFSGTREGMTHAQRAGLRRVLAWLRPEEFHHGHAEGADTEAAEIVVEEGSGWARRPVVHPHKPAKRTPEAMLARNLAIVGAVDVLIAAPESDEEALRSGTWATVRYARAAHVPYLVLPRGSRPAVQVLPGMSRVRRR